MCTYMFVKYGVWHMGGMPIHNRVLTSAALGNFMAVWRLKPGCPKTKVTALKHFMPLTVAQMCKQSNTEF